MSTWTLVTAVTSALPGSASQPAAFNMSARASAQVETLPNLLESSHLVQKPGPVNQLHHSKHLYKEVPLPHVATGCPPSSAGCFYLCGCYVWAEQKAPMLRRITAAVLCRG